VNIFYSRSHPEVKLTFVNMKIRYLQKYFGSEIIQKIKIKTSSSVFKDLISIFVAIIVENEKQGIEAYPKTVA